MCLSVWVHAGSAMVTTAIDWVMSPAVHSAGLVMWDIASFPLLPRLLVLTFHLVQESEGGGDT